MKIIINDIEYDVIVAQTEEEREKGLQGVEEMDNNEGCLFIYNEIQPEGSFWMKDTDIPLDIIFIDEDLEVISVYEGIPHSEDLITEYNFQYVLELNRNSDVEPGDEVEFEYSDLEINKMYIIGSDGKPQMELEGEERIFSRKNTKTLIKMAKRAFTSKTDRDYKKLGKKLFEYIEIQSNNKPEYVVKKD